MPKSCRYLLARLQIEKDKLLGWAILAKVSEHDKSLGRGLKLQKHTILDALREIQVLLLDFSQIDRRYQLKLVAAEQEDPHNTGDFKRDQVSSDAPCLTQVHRLTS